ncbi:MAG: nicotinate-nicotinamide nucleotide adenylyltransferase [Alistipes finegoldii]
MKRVMLYFGSFNPVHKGHIAWRNMSWSRDLRRSVLVVSPQSPYKRPPNWPEMDRFEMAEACAARACRSASNLRSWSFCCPNPRTQSIRCAIDREPRRGDGVFDPDGRRPARTLDGWKEYEKSSNTRYTSIPPRRTGRAFRRTHHRAEDARCRISSTECADRSSGARTSADARRESRSTSAAKGEPAARGPRTAQIAANPEHGTYTERGKLHYRSTSGARRSTTSTARCS